MASKTIELRKVVKSLLKEVNNNVFYEEASSNATFPYLVYEFETVNLNNYPRDDIFMTVDVWDKAEDTITVETLADNIEKALNFTNNPTKNVLPTFYLESRMSLRDEDKQIRRRQLKFTIQNYYLGDD
ncbi:MAG: tail completion protein gp17 [Clostridium sp.]